MARLHVMSGASILVFSCTPCPSYTRHQTSHIRETSWADTLHKRDKILRSRSLLGVNDKNIPLSQKYFQQRHVKSGFPLESLASDPLWLYSSCLSKQEFYDSPECVVISNERWKKTEQNSQQTEFAMSHIKNVLQKIYCRQSTRGCEHNTRLLTLNISYTTTGHAERQRDDEKTSSASQHSLMARLVGTRMSE